METDEHGDIIADNRDHVFTWVIHPSEVDLRKCIANRDEYLHYDITSQAEKEFNTILHQDCLCQQDEAREAHFFEQGLPGYQPFLLHDGIFSTHSGETNYCHQCSARIVHPCIHRMMLQQAACCSPPASTSHAPYRHQFFRKYHILFRS